MRYLSLVFILLLSCKTSKREDAQDQKSDNENIMEARSEMEKEIRRQEKTPSMKKNDSTRIIPPRPHSNNLMVYDVCVGKWVDTGLPYRERPVYSETGFDADKFTKHWSFLRSVPGGESMNFQYLDLFNVEKFLKAGGNNDIPKVLRGIWWMHGNPASDVIIATSRGKFNPETKVFELYFTDIDAYAYLPSTISQMIVSFFHFTRKWMVIDFTGTNPDAMKPGEEVNLYVRMSNSWTGVPLPKGLYDLPTVYIKDGLWKRQTGFVTGLSRKKREDYHCYNMRRIVDEDGNKLPEYDLFVKLTQERARAGEAWEGYDKVLMYPAHNK